ncbi:hypothetical protein [Desulfosporosinus sp. FKB]|nr:hypothetical protein [Desulfosporosinus sp. FKB]
MTAHKCAPSVLGGSGDSSLLFGSNKEGVKESVLAWSRLRKRKRERNLG